MEKKRTSGCLIAAVIVGVGAALFCSSIALITFTVPGPRRAFTQLTKTASVALKARSAVGTKELRAAGCSDAYVVEAKDFPDAVDAGTLEVIISCHVREKSLSCDEVAAAYRAVPGSNPGALRAIVMRADDKSHLCEQGY